MVAAADAGARGFVIDANPKDFETGDFFERVIGSTSGVICMTVNDPERMKRLLKR